MLGGFDGWSAYTFVIVGLVGVLLLGAHQADESGHRRIGFGLLAAAIATLIGPLTVIGIALVVLWYAVFIGLPIAGVVLLVRRARRRA